MICSSLAREKKNYFRIAYHEVDTNLADLKNHSSR